MKACASFLLIMGFLSQSLLGCTCVATSFCQTAFGAELVVLVEKRESLDQESGIQAIVLEEWQGKAPTQEIRIWGNSTFCGPSVVGIGPNEKLVVALFPVTAETHPDGPAQPGDFYLPTCSNSILPVNSGKVRGLLRSEKEIEELSIGKLKRSLQACSFPPVLFSPRKEGIRVFPLSFYDQTDQAELWELTLYDTQGKLLRCISSPKSERQLFLRTRELEAGLYLIKVTIDEKVRFFKGILGTPGQ